MIKKLSLSIMATAALLATSLSASELSQKEKEEIQKYPIFAGANVNIDKSKDLGDVYLVRAKGGEGQDYFEFYITKDKKTVIVGKGVNPITKEQHTLIDANVILEGKEHFTYGEGKEVLYVFTDPACPFCQQFEHKMPSLAKKYKFKIFLLALPMHKQAPGMIEYILSAKTDKEKAERLFKIALGSKDYEQRELSVEDEVKIKEATDRVVKLAQLIGLRGTPTVLNTKLQQQNWSLLK